MSEKIDIKGVVETILAIQEFASGFKKQTLVIDTGGKFPQKVAIDFAKEKIELLANIVEGQEVTVGVNIRGNEYNGKYYVSLAGWKLDAGAVIENEDDKIPF
jgi:single-strand DNA-binding protein